MNELHRPMNPSALDALPTIKVARPSLPTVVAIVGLLLNGCAHLPVPMTRGESLFAQHLYERQEYVRDLSSKPDKGVLEVRCLPPSQQLLVDDYQIAVDDLPPLTVFKHSVATLTLDAGPHTVVLSAVGFGRPMSQTIAVPAGGKTTIEYTGPYFMWSDGTLKRR